ncbi:enoyl-CoA hydratase/carnithine racemase [Pseudomonas rhodesiae]|uniref:enoyl-CoA hydratase-related protein n=1 Tax=Pseudomonas rhodesiae TaxID=76760 RepID=UPI002407181A|nr:enoyl-CoA hydratase-related protein [Pseudomonas rhodesiae]MDF9771432.1 enoyl-CoA hydratase/carnithine racemase [Pseudomonas rhodesiae]
MTDAILQHREARVLTLQLNRPDKKNALTRAMYSHLAQALEQADADPNIHAVLIQGSSECFTAGNDIGDFLQQPPSDLDSPPFHFMKSLLNCRKPVIAAVAGVAVGIGTTLLLHCDLVYVSRDARLRMPFVNLGFVPGVRLQPDPATFAGARQSRRITSVGRRVYRRTGGCMGHRY